MNILQSISSLWRKPVFDGEIGRMIVVAAPAGAGKSTFLDNPNSGLQPEQFPEHLSDLTRLGRSYLHVAQLNRQNTRRIDEVAVHCDTLAAFTFGKTAAYDRNQMLADIDFQSYRDNRKLGEYCTRTEELDFVILYVRRSKNLQRWTNREQARKADNRTVGVNLILQDNTNGSELHRATYQAWLQFSESVNPRSITVIDANNDDHYSLMELDDFRGEIDAGY